MQIQIIVPHNKIPLLIQITIIIYQVFFSHSHRYIFRERFSKLILQIGWIFDLFSYQINSINFSVYIYKLFLKTNFPPKI